VGQAGAALVQPVGEFRHPEPALGRLGEPDEDLVVVDAQAELPKVVVELGHQARSAQQVRAPRHLLLGVKPPGPSHHRHGTSVPGM
jgi:hypothetical protein